MKAALLFLLISISFLWICRRSINRIVIVVSLGFDVIFLFLVFPFPMGVFFSYYILIIPLIIYVFLVIKTFVSFKKDIIITKSRIKSRTILLTCILLSIYTSCQMVVYLRGYDYKETPVELSFPFKNGFYTVISGGNGENSPLMNYHFSCELFKEAGVNISMKYAVDIIKLNLMASNRNSIFPRQLEDYEIFGENLYSPCNGEVVNVQDGWTDNKIGERNLPLYTGNTIIIKTNNVYILMGHLKHSSIVVKIGDKVTQGQLIASVGSSGQSDYPHLHMQAMKEPYWGAEGLPIIFDGKFPVKYSVFIK